MDKAIDAGCWRAAPASTRRWRSFPDDVDGRGDAGGERRGQDQAAGRSARRAVAADARRRRAMSDGATWPSCTGWRRRGGAGDRRQGTLAGRADEGAARPHRRSSIRSSTPSSGSMARPRWQAATAAEAESDRGPAARAAARRAGRHQGHHRCRGPADDRPFEDPDGQHRDRRRGLRQQAARRRRHRAGQALDARIRHRRAELRPAVAAGAQSVEHRPSSRRLVVGLRAQASPPACSRWRWAATPAAACAIRRAAAASSG